MREGARKHSLLKGSATRPGVGPNGKGSVLLVSLLATCNLLTLLVEGPQELFSGQKGNSGTTIALKTGPESSVPY